MESILNILWVVIAAAGLAVWRLRWVREERASHRNPTQEWTAIICVLIALFFAVSLTDDLHSELLVYDECSSVRRLTAVWSAAHEAGHAANASPVTGPAVLPRRDAPFISSFVRRLFQFDGMSIEKKFRDLPSGRAPPTSDL